MRRYADIVWFKAYADLRAERERTYLGVLWWIFEPLLFMVVFWLVFDRVLKRGGEGFVPFVLVGLVVWQWMKSCISHGASAVHQSRNLIQQVALPPVVFPLVTIATDSFKFLVVLALLLVLLLAMGQARSPTLLALPAVLVVELVFIAAVTVWVSAFVPFVPDLRIITETLLTALMFLSGIFFDGDALAEPVREWFYLNPVAFLIDQVRAVLLDGEWPSWPGLGLTLLVSFAALAAGSWMLERMRRYYPKLPI